MRPWLTWIVCGWSLGVILCSLRPLLGWHTLWRLQRSGVSPASDETLAVMARISARLGLRRAVRVVHSTLAQVPVVVGYLRPVILLPVSLVTTIPLSQLEAILAHELAHVQRHDFVVNLLQTLVETLFFYHPAIWWLSHQVRVEREHCCDDLVVALLGNRVEYGRVLVAIEQLRGQKTVLALGAADGSLLSRVRRIVGVGYDRAADERSSAALFGIATLCVTCALSMTWSLVAKDDVSLQPGKKTDVTVKGDSLPDVTDEPDEPDEPAEAGESQMLSWSMLVDGTLAETIAKLGRNELPRQGTFRVLECDAATVRRALFDSAVKAHIYSEVQAPGILALSTNENDWHDETAFQTVRMQHQSGAVSFANGMVNGRYRSMPGRPFELELTSFSLDTDPFPANGMKQKIEPQPLAFRGDIPIGSAVAFIGKAEGTPGREEFHAVRVYEAVPKLTEPAKRLLADVTWFKAGRPRARAALRQAEDFNSRAPSFPNELPARWTKKLPHGGSVSLVAIARPQTHPFCWWDADGQPRSADWSIQQHAFGPVAMLALVCVRDPAAGDLQRQGVSYTFHANYNYGPLPLYRPWGDLADSELYLFCVYNTDNEQRPTVGVYAGDGPWAELGKLKPKQEVTLGRADYLLGESPLKNAKSSNLIVGRRYLADEEIRLQVIDRQGKVWPTRPNLSRSGISDTPDVPAQWEGWCDYKVQVPVGEIDQYVLESRPRQWNSFAGFASELDAAPKDELPKLKPAQPVAFAPVFLTGQLTRKLDEWLQTKYGNIFHEEDRRAIVEDFRRFIDRHQPPALLPERASLIARGFGSAVESVNGDYLEFFPGYRELKWRLGLAFEQRPLSPAEQARREQQRNDLRKIVREIPLTQFHAARTHGHAIAQLDKLFDDPWHGWFHEPLSDEDVAQFQKDKKNWVINNVITAHSHFDTIVMRVKARSMQADGSFDRGPFPLDAEVIANSKSDLLRFHTRYADQAAFNGLNDLVFDESSPPRRRILDFSRTTVEVPDSAPAGLKAVQEWAAEKQVGLLAYESARHGLFMLRGAKLGVLPVSTWHEADRLTDAELFRIVADQSRDSILLADHYGPRPESTGYGPAPDGPLLVVATAAGELGVVRVESVSHHGITARLRPRPNAVRVKVAASENHTPSEALEPIAGEVVDAVTGARLEGATVRFRFRKMQRRADESDEPVAELVFRNVGQFTFRLPEGVDPQMRILVEGTAEHPDYQALSPSVQYLQSVLDDNPKYARDFIRKIALSPGRVVTGQVLDIKGRPAKGIPIFAGRNRRGWENGCRHKTMTDADGRYRLVVPANGGRGRIYVVPNDAAAVSRAISTDFGEQPVFKLLRGTRLLGSVKDAEGHGIAGVVVQANGGERIPWRYAVSDAQGRYSLPPCQYGKYVVELVDEHWVPELQKTGVRLPDVFLSQTVELAKNAPVEQVLDFQPSESVRVTARYMTSDDKPVTGGRLSMQGGLANVAWQGRFREVSDEPGLYELRVPRGFHGSFDPHDYGYFLRIVRQPTDDAVFAQDSATKFDRDGIAFLVRGYQDASVTLRPVFDGKPVEIPTYSYPQFADPILAKQIGAREAYAGTSMDTATGGRRFLVHPAIDLLLELDIPGFQPWQKTVQVPEGRSQMIEVALEPNNNRAAPRPATVVGTVVTPDNKPVAGIEVVAFEAGKRLPQKFTTDDRGQFHVPKAWRESDHYLTLVARDGRERLGWLDFFFHAHSDNGQKSADGSFQMVLLPLNRTIRGQLLHQTGQPLPRVPLQVEYLQHEINFAAVHWQYQKIGGEPLISGGVTDDEGRYELKLPADSFAWIGNVHPDWVHQRIQVAKDKDAVAAVKLVRAAKVAGVVTRSGKPLAGVGIGAQAVAPDIQSGGWGDAKTDAGGNYVIGGLAAGEFNIMLLDGADKTLTAPAYAAAELKSGETYQADFSLSVGRRLAGRVVEAQSGEPIVNCTVGYYGAARPRAGAACLSAETNSRGEFEFFVPPGPSHVYIAESRESMPESSRDVDVPVDRDPDLVVLKAGPKPEDDGGPLGMKIFVGPPLDRKVSMHFQRAPLADVLDRICKSAAVTLNLDGPGLASVDYTKDMPVTVDADRITLREALMQVLKPFERLSFTVDENEIFVSNRRQVEAREKAQAEPAPKQDEKKGAQVRQPESDDEKAIAKQDKAAIVL
ncbi:MAG TPA: M56 family metallopeptidase, partial [Planctomycetaceae bacterium]